MSMNRCSQCPGWADAKYLSEHQGFCPACWNALIPGFQRTRSKPEQTSHPIRMTDYAKEQEKKQ